MNDDDLRAFRAAADRETAQMIAEYGHQVVSVFPTEAGDGQPFSYTVGRTGKGRPELLITGALDPYIAGAILNDAAAMDDVTPLEPGDVDGLLVNYPMRVIEADPESGEMFQAIHYYRPGEVRALQLVWPDPEARFPGDDGYRYPDDAQPLHPRL